MNTSQAVEVMHIKVKDRTGAVEKLLEHHWLFTEYCDWKPTDELYF